MNHNFKEAFLVQKKFTEKVFREKHGLDVFNLTRDERVKWTKEYILSGSKELYEMLDELNWKQHRFSVENDNMGNFLEEGIDSFKFLLNVCIINGFDENDFFTKFLEKSIVVDIRYEQEKLLQSALDSAQQYVVIDIDGVLNDYPKNVIRYFNYLGYNYKSVDEFKVSDMDKYREIKTKFCVSGEERNNKIKDGSLEFIKKCKDSGYGVILLTSRPYNKFTRLFFDTIHWLKGEQIVYDFLFFAKNKEEFLVDSFASSSVKFVIDDQIENANQLSKKFKTYLIPNETIYENSSDIISKKVNVIENLNEIEL